MSTTTGCGDYRLDFNMSLITSPHDLNDQRSHWNGNDSRSAISWHSVFFPHETDEFLYRLLLVTYTFWVIIGNSLVCLGSLKSYKYGQVCPIYMCYVSSLDVFIGVFLLPIMTIIKLVGYFPFSQFACNLFVFWDYYIICAAAFGHLILIYFFYWEITSPATLNRSPYFHLKVCYGSFLAVNIVWLPAFLADLFKENPDGAPYGTDLSPNGTCGFSNHNNEYSAAYLGLFGFLVPYIAGFLLWGMSARILWRRYHGFAWHAVEMKWRRLHHKQGHSSATNTPPRHARPFCPEHNHIQQEVRQSQEDGEAHHVLHEATVVYALFVLFTTLRAPFYVYYIVGIFNSRNFPQNLSIGIYWIMDINSVLSCLFHLTLEPAVRTGLKEIFCCTRNADEGDDMTSTRRVSSENSTAAVVTLVKTASNGPNGVCAGKDNRKLTMIDFSKGLPWPYIH